MTEISRHEPGSFAWAELATSDSAGAKKFYSELFGWTAVDTPMGPGPGDVYTRLQIGGKDVAALYRMMREQEAQGIPPHWMLYVAVESADAAAEKVRSLGGTVVAAPFDVAEHGRMAVIQDPEGATLAVWQARAHAGIQRVEEHGTMCWAELQTRDPERAGKFYTGLFGWGLKTGDPAYWEVTRAGASIGGIMTIRPEMGDIPANWGLYFDVRDCDATVAKAKSLGGQLYFGPMDIEKTGRFAVLADPQGAVFSVIKLT